MGASHQCEKDSAGALLHTKNNRNPPDDLQASSALENPKPDDAGNCATEDDPIGLENEPTVFKLALVHTSLCLCTFLVGLVSFAHVVAQI